jgi:hypothetical protein
MPRLSPAAARLPSGDSATALTATLCPVNVLRSPYTSLATLLMRRWARIRTSRSSERSALRSSGSALTPSLLSSSFALTRTT